jgi:hypothetical protein
MRNARAVAANLAMVLAVLVVPAPASAWGVDAHRYIMGRAIDLLPAELKPFFERHRAELVVRVVDPDVWRNVGWEDDYNHFLDFGASEYGAYPFTALPRDYDQALQKFGRPVLERNGLLPWRLSEFFGHLRRSFEGFARNNPYAISDSVVFAAVMSHYIQDAHQPLHATINYDGAETGQRGIHARFETELFERYRGKLSINPAPVRAITSPRDLAFDVLIESYQRVEPLLAADRKAAAGRDTYDAAYFDALFAGVRSLAERCLAEAITDTASLITSAWEQAGRPALRTEMPRQPQRIRPQ